MRLKVLTTIGVIVGVGLVLSWPWVMGPRPDPTEENKRAVADYAMRLLVYFGATALVWLGVAILALIMVRQARKQFVVEEKALVKELVEGTLKDHERKKS